MGSILTLPSERGIIFLLVQFVIKVVSFAPVLGVGVARTSAVVSIVALVVGLVIVLIKIIGLFDLFHKLNHLAQIMIKMVKTLMAHLFLPCLGSDKKDDVNQLIPIGGLVGIKGWKIGTFFVVDTRNVL